MIFVKKQCSPFCSTIFDIEIAASWRFLPAFVHNKTSMGDLQDVSLHMGRSVSGWRKVVELH